MKLVIMALIAFTGFAASADTFKLGSANVDSDDNEVTIDARLNTPAVDSVTLAVSGQAIRFDEVRVVYRTGNGFGPYKATRFQVRQLVKAGESVTLELPATGYPVRRIEIETDTAGFGDNARISAYGSN